MRSWSLAVLTVSVLCPEIGWAQASIFADDFEIGGTCSWTAGNPAEACPPEFGGLVLVAATGDDELTMAWLPADDDATPVDQILYRVHLGPEAGFEPTPQNLVATVTGGTQVVLTGLSPASVWSALVIAEDNDGMQSFDRTYMTAATPAVPTVLNGTTPLESAVDLELGEATIDGPDLIFQRGPSSVPPTVGAVLIGPLAGGGGFLRGVDTVSLTPTEIRVGTVPASLGQAVDQTHLISAGSIPDPDRAVADDSELWSTGGPVAPGGAVLSRRHTADGTRSSRIDWGRRLLGVETVRHAVATETFRSRPGPVPGSVEGIFFPDDGGEITLSAGVEFRPELVTDAVWTLGGLQEAEITARGVFSLDAVARYEWSTGGSTQATVPLFTTSWTAVYAVGAVPVYQKITLSVEAEFTATAQASVNAETSATASSTVEVGLRYEQGTGWQPTSSLDFERGLTADLSVLGSVSAEIRFVPQLEVEFYEAVAGWFTIEPSLSGLIEAEGTVMPTCAPVQLTHFDVDLEVDVNAGVDLTLLDDYPLWSGNIWDPAPWVLFDLPQVALTADGTGPVDLTADVTDGAANPFDPSSVLWSVSPATATITPEPSDPLQAVLDCTEAETYTATFSGFGSLGEIARRCTQIDVACSPGPPPMITITLPGAVTMDLIHIPAGTFWMGSPLDERGRSVWEDLHQVTLTSGYYMGMTEVTQAQWEAVMGVPMSTFCGDYGIGPEYPVYCVSWNEICGGSTGADCLPNSFIGRVNTYLADTRFRLPTEAQWERAARAGTQTRFSHGDVLDCDDNCGVCPAHDLYMVWCGNSAGGVEPVNSRFANDFGLVDTHGNISEWVADWWDDGPGFDPQIDPTGPASGTHRATKGGGWDFDARLCRPAIRGASDPNYSGYYIGFRLARSE